MGFLFVGNPVETVLFDCTAVIWGGVEVWQSLRHRADATSSDRGSRLVLVACVGVALLLAGLAAAWVPGASIPRGTAWFGISLVWLWCGIGLRVWSFRTLGRYFTFTVMTNPDQPVISTGPYRYLRHPSYTGFAMELMGLGAIYGNWLSLAVLALVPLIGLVYRIRVEEAALTARLGAAYTTYAAGRKRLLPFVW